jgi:DNA repair exonuclease SbcCD ATPase subunit
MRRKPLAVSRVLWASVLSMLLLSGAAQAQTLDDKLRAQLRSVLDQLHALQDAQASQQAEMAAAEKERDALKAKLAAGGGRIARKSAGTPDLQAELDRLKAEDARLAQTVQRDQAEIAKYKEAYTQVADSSQQVHAERDRMAQQANASLNELADCETKNIQLVKIGRDVLAAYIKVGVKDALERGEPFIGLKRVKMERIAQDYGDKVYQAKFDPRAVKPPPAAPAASPATPPASPAARPPQ